MSVMSLSMYEENCGLIYFLLSKSALCYLKDITFIATSDTFEDVLGVAFVLGQRYSRWVF